MSRLDPLFADAFLAAWFSSEVSRAVSARDLTRRPGAIQIWIPPGYQFVSTGLSLHSRLLCKHEAGSGHFVDGDASIAWVADLRCASCGGAYAGEREGFQGHAEVAQHAGDRCSAPHAEGVVGCGTA